jgi:hypothetical protein
MKQPPSLPDKTNRIGLAYDLQPDGSVFNPPLTLVFSYSDTPPSQIPEGVDEKNLVLAYWDKITGKWVELDCTVDPEANTITARVGHFTTFAALAHSSPARFTAGPLSIVPAEAAEGQKITVSTTVTNDGDISGDYDAILKIDDYLVAGSRQFTLAGHASEAVSFTVTAGAAGTHKISLAGLSGTFTVKRETGINLTGLRVSPSEASPGEEITISVQVANNGAMEDTCAVNLKINNAATETQNVTVAAGGQQNVTFTTKKEAPGKYSVDVNGIAGSFTINDNSKATAAPQGQTGQNTWLLVIGAVAVAVAVAVVIRVWFRKKRAQ